MSILTRIYYFLIAFQIIRSWAPTISVFYRAEHYRVQYSLHSAVQWSAMFSVALTGPESEPKQLTISKEFFPLFAILCDCDPICDLVGAKYPAWEILFEKSNISLMLEMDVVHYVMCLSFLSTLLELWTPKVIWNVIINSWEFLSNEWVFRRSMYSWQIARLSNIFLEIMLIICIHTHSIFDNIWI